jgi:hypothetical protein
MAVSVDFAGASAKDTVLSAEVGSMCAETATAAARCKPSLLEEAASISATDTGFSPEAEPMRAAARYEPALLEDAAFACAFAAECELPLLLMTPMTATILCASDAWESMS